MITQFIAVIIVILCFLMVAVFLSVRLGSNNAEEIPRVQSRDSDDFTLKRRTIRQFFRRESNRAILEDDTE